MCDRQATIAFLLFSLYFERNKKKTENKYKIKYVTFHKSQPVTTHWILFFCVSSFFYFNCVVFRIVAYTNYKFVFPILCGNRRIHSHPIHIHFKTKTKKIFFSSISNVECLQVYVCTVRFASSQFAYLFQKYIILHLSRIQSDHSNTVAIAL